MLPNALAAAAVNAIDQQLLAAGYGHSTELRLRDRPLLLRLFEGLCIVVE